MGDTNRAFLGVHWGLGAGCGRAARVVLWRAPNGLQPHIPLSQRNWGCSILSRTSCSSCWWRGTERPCGVWNELQHRESGQGRKGASGRDLPVCAGNDQQDSSAAAVPAVRARTPLSCWPRNAPARCGEGQEQLLPLCSHGLTVFPQCLPSS